MLELLSLMLYQLGMTLLSPIFWLVVVIIFIQTYRMAKMKQKFFQLPKEAVLKKAIMLLLFGLLGGVAGSMLLILVGISLDEIGIEWLWIFAVMLVLVRQRFLCFSYSGGLLAISCYCLGWPEVNIAHLMALVAILHMVEALLMVLSSRYGSIPIYTRLQDGRIVGGYMLQMFWPLPLVAMLPFLATPLELTEGVLTMPEWWPLLRGQLSGEINVVYQLIPILAALGYSDLVLTETVERKVRRSAAYLFLYSLILLALAILGDFYKPCSILAALFAPLAHEGLIQWEKKKEKEGKPYYISPEGQCLVLDVLPGTKEIKPGDVLVSNGTENWLEKGIIPAPHGKYGPYLILNEDKGLAAVIYSKLSKKFANGSKMD